MPHNRRLVYTTAELRAFCTQILQMMQPATLADCQITIHHLSYIPMRPQVEVPEHTHGFYEALILLNGHAEYTGQNRCPIMPGSVLMHPPQVPHAWRTTDAPCSYLVIWFSLDPAVQLTQYCFQQPTLLDEVQALFHAVNVKEPGWRALLSARLWVILATLLAQANWPPTEAVTPDDEIDGIVDNACQFLRDNLARPLTLSVVADHLGVSKRSLTRYFRAVTGKSLMESLCVLRMDVASSLLKTTDLPLSVIAPRVGMPDASYFCRCFKRHFNVTPQQFRHAYHPQDDTE
ncbi:MAG TPA: AraC family transcriptional regulator [Armatimonadota bacterium]|nr:AraC family transcriptional regulator [Armatimonadota bacterium]